MFDNTDVFTCGCGARISEPDFEFHLYRVRLHIDNCTGPNVDGAEFNAERPDLQKRV